MHKSGDAHAHVYDVHDVLDVLDVLDVRVLDVLDVLDVHAPTLTGVTELSAKISTHAADTQKTTPTASELAEQVNTKYGGGHCLMLGSFVRAFPSLSLPEVCIALHRDILHGSDFI